MLIVKWVINLGDSEDTASVLGALDTVEDKLYGILDTTKNPRVVRRVKALIKRLIQSENNRKSESIYECREYY